MKEYKFKIAGTYENNSHEFKTTVTVRANTLRAAKEEAVRQISWPPNGLDWERWSVVRKPVKS